MMKIVLATRNRGKIKEMQELLAGLPIELIAASQLEGAPEVAEDADTLEGNARKKAEVLHEYSGLPSLADDTGLEVSALAGAPGVHSARFAGPHATDADNRRHLLDLLDGEHSRDARFRTVISFVDQDGPHHFEGICSGTIGFEEKGDLGFGYDSLFIPEGEDRTFAELPSEEKNAISHRGRALRELASYLRERLS